MSWTLQFRLLVIVELEKEVAQTSRPPEPVPDLGAWRVPRARRLAEAQATTRDREQEGRQVGARDPGIYRDSFTLVLASTPEECCQPCGIGPETGATSAGYSPAL